MNNFTYVNHQFLLNYVWMLTILPSWSASRRASYRWSSRLKNPIGAHFRPYDKQTQSDFSGSTSKAFPKEIFFGVFATRKPLHIGLKKLFDKDADLGTVFQCFWDAKMMIIFTIWKLLILSPSSTISLCFLSVFVRNAIHNVIRNVLCRKKTFQTLESL